MYAHSTQQKLIIKALSSEQYDGLSEIALNIYTGTYPLSKKYINHLKPYESYIRLLGSREVSNREKRRILLKNNSLVSLLLKPIVTYQRQMAKEMILVPKLKYERLLKQVDPVKEPLTQDTTTIEQTLKQSP